MRCGYYLVAEDPGIAPEEVELPSVEQIVVYSCADCGFSKLHWTCGAMQNLFIVAAQVSEKLGRHQDAISYADGVFFSKERAGTELPCAQIIGHGIRGRSFAGLGRIVEAAAAFEAAAQLAGRWGYRLWEAFALRDLKLRCTPNHHHQPGCSV